MTRRLAASASVVAASQTTDPQPLTPRQIMFPAWRLKIREARLALDGGRWDEAGELLQRESLQGFLPAKELSSLLATQLLQRAQQRFGRGESSAGWKDLQQAGRLGGDEERIAELREEQAQQGLEQVRHLLQCGELNLAQDQITRLEQRTLGNAQRRVWKLITRLFLQAREQAEQGKPTAAVAQLQRAGKLLPDPKDSLAGQIAHRQKQLQRDAIEIKRLAATLHEALSNQAWTEVLTAANALLELAPEHRPARQARRQAWQEVGMNVTQPYHGHKPAAVARRRSNWLAKDQLRAGSTFGPNRSAQVDTVTSNSKPGKRVIAWIDEVGAFLVCLGDQLVLGQPTTSSDSGTSGAEIPILADLSRRHATIDREGESYVLTPIHPVYLDGVKLAGPTVLRNDAVVQLGEAVQMRFRRPHALSATAVLTIESHHKTEPAVDSIVLMSETCILGPQAHSHIQCRGWSDEIVLFRRGDQLSCRSQMPLEIDGEPCGGQAELGRNCRLEADQIALSIEQL